MKTLIRYFFGLGIILIIFWIRFLRDRQAEPLFKMPLFIWKIFLVCLMILHISFIYLNLKKIFNKTKKTAFWDYLQEFFILKVLLNAYKEYIATTPELLYNRVTKTLDFSSLIKNIILPIRNKCYYPKTFLFVLSYIPKLSLALLFSIEILFYDKLHFFYIMVPFFTIPLIFHIIKFIIKTFCDKYLYHLELYLKIVLFSNDPDKIQISLQPELPTGDDALTKEQLIKSFPILVEQWALYRKIYFFIKDIEEQHQKLNAYVSLIISTLYIIIWFYLLLKLQ